MKLCDNKTYLKYLQLLMVIMDYSFFTFKAILNRNVGYCLPQGQSYIPRPNIIMADSKCF